MQLAALALAATATLAVLVTHAPHLTFSLTTLTGEQLALVVAWAVALITAAWISATSAVGLFALVSRNRTAARLAHVCAPRFVRRMVEASLVATLLVTPARAPVAGPAIAPAVGLAGDQPVVRAPAAVVAPTPKPLPKPTPEPKPAPKTKPSPLPAPTPTATPTAAGTHVVVPGDNLWTIARAQLVARGHTDPDIATTARYWRTVVERNREALRSHDPNVIYPGETVALPDPG